MNALRSVWQLRWIVAFAGLAVGGAFALSHLSSGRAEQGALSYAPAETTTLARVRVVSAMRSEVFRPWLGSSGISQWERVCNYDPLRELDQLVLFWLGTDETPFARMGFAVTGAAISSSNEREEFLACVRRVMRGDLGEMSSRTVAGQRAISIGRNQTLITFLGSEAAVAGEEQTLQESIAAYRGRRPSLTTDLELASVWEQLATYPDAAFVSRIPSRWTRDFRPAVGERIEGLRHLTLLGVGLRYQGSRIAIRGIFRADDPAAVSALERGLRQWVDHALEQPFLAISVIGRILRSFQFQTEEREVLLSAEASEADFAATVRVLVELMGAGSATNDASPGRGRRPPNTPRAEPVPDETITPSETQ